MKNPSGPYAERIAALLLSGREIVRHDLEPMYEVSEVTCAAMIGELAQLLDWPIREARQGGQAAWAEALETRRESVLEHYREAASAESTATHAHRTILQLSNLLLVSLTEATERSYGWSSKALAGRIASVLRDFDEDVAELAENIASGRHGGSRSP